MPQSHSTSLQTTLTSSETSLHSSVMQSPSGGPLATVFGENGQKEGDHLSLASQSPSLSPEEVHKSTRATFVITATDCMSRTDVTSRESVDSAEIGSDR
jgi:hypothetical protein